MHQFVGEGGNLLFGVLVSFCFSNLRVFQGMVCRFKLRAMKWPAQPYLWYF